MPGNRRKNESLPSMINQTFSEAHYPGLYQASDQISQSAQKEYLAIVSFDLLSMIGAALLAVYNYDTVGAKELVYIVAGILLLLSMVLSIILLNRKPEDVWYQGRALAESCKTLTWRFMTCSESFEHSIPPQQARSIFIDKLKDISNEFSALTKEMDAALIKLPPISPLMEDIRSMNTADRKEYYIRNRILDQQQWYSRKAKWNGKRYVAWFGVIISFQALSLTSMVYLIANPDSGWNFVGLFTTIGASALSWLQLKQHQNLKQAYSTAAMELTFIGALSDSITTDDQLAKFVLDSENAVSREHTLWIAQRRR